MTYHVAGIDLSMTNAAVAVLRGDLPEPAITNVLSSPVKTARNAEGDLYAGLLDRRNRLQSIAARVVRAALAGLDREHDDAPLFVIESPLYRANTGSGAVHDRAGLWWLVVHLLYKHGLVVEVSTTTMKRYATGSGGTPKGSTSKAPVTAAMPRMFPGVYVTDDNAADALALAAMGARALGHPREPSPQRVHPAALDAVRWPTDTIRRNA